MSDLGNKRLSKDYKKIGVNISFLYLPIITVFFIFLAHHSSMLLHEWTHGMFAWIFGYKKNPFDIYYGDWTLLNAWESIDYKAILGEGRGWIISIIAISPIILGGILYLAGILLLSVRKIQSKKILWYFLFWFTLSNLGQVFDYIPGRTFTQYQDGLLRGDIGHFIQGINLSPWIVFLPGISFVVIGIIIFLIIEVPQLCVIMKISSSRRKKYLMVVLIYFFSWYGMAGFQYSFLSNIFCCLSILMVPIIFVIFNKMILD